MQNCPIFTNTVCSVYFSGWKATMFVTENNAGSQIKLRFCTATLLEQKNNYFGI